MPWSERSDATPFEGDRAVFVSQARAFPCIHWAQAAKVCGATATPATWRRLFLSCQALPCRPLSGAEMRWWAPAARELPQPGCRLQHGGPNLFWFCRSGWALWLPSRILNHGTQLALLMRALLHTCNTFRAAAGQGSAMDADPALKLATSPQGSGRTLQPAGCWRLHMRQNTTMASHTSPQELRGVEQRWQKPQQGTGARRPTHTQACYYGQNRPTKPVRKQQQGRSDALRTAAAAAAPSAAGVSANHRCDTCAAASDHAAAAWAKALMYLEREGWSSCGRLNGVQTGAPTNRRIACTGCRVDNGVGGGTGGCQKGPGRRRRRFARHPQATWHAARGGDVA